MSWLALCMGSTWAAYQKQGRQMLFESAFQRFSIIYILLGLVPDILIAWGGTRWIDGGLIGFIGIFVALQILYFLVWAKQTVWAWITFWAWGRRQMAQLTLDALREAGYPEPDGYYVDVLDYFRAVASDEAIPIGIRLKAAIDIGAIDSLRHSGQAMENQRTHIVFEDAVRLYKQDWRNARMREHEKRTPAT